MGSETKTSPPSLICPTCSRPLAANELETNWMCASGHRYPVVGGILDCRPPLEGFDIAADRRLAEELASSDGSLEELLRQYWDRQPDVPNELVARFVTGDLIGGGRAAAVADQIEGMRHDRVDRGVVALEVGAGTAALGTELARRAGWVVASDVSLAWLVIAQRRLVESGLDNISLVAATGDALPFGEGTFDLVVAADVIEHVPDAAVLVRSCHRVLKPGGVFWLSTPNRFSLTPEPHVRVWGVGLVPRRWANAYVGWVRGVGYDDIHTLSRGELHRLLAGTGGEVEVAAPAISGSVTSTYTPMAQRLIRVYNAVQGVAALRRLLLWMTPLFHAIVRRQPANV